VLDLSRQLSGEKNSLYKIMEELQIDNQTSLRSLRLFNVNVGRQNRVLDGTNRGPGKTNRAAEEKRRETDRSALVKPHLHVCT